MRALRLAAVAALLGGCTIVLPNATISGQGTVAVASPTVATLEPEAAPITVADVAASRDTTTPQATDTATPNPEPSVTPTPAPTPSKTPRPARTSRPTPEPTETPAPEPTPTLLPTPTPYNCLEAWAIKKAEIEASRDEAVAMLVQQGEDPNGTRIARVRENFAKLSQETSRTFGCW